MRIQHKLGDTMEEDWSGADMDIFDLVIGEDTWYFFVAIVSCSSYVYAEIRINRTKE